MNPYVPYEALEAKIATKKERLLDQKKFRSLLNCTSIEKMTEILLREYPFRDILAGQDKQSIHRDTLETLFYQYSVSEQEDILHYFSGPYREFLKTFFMEFEIYDLLLILRKISMGESAKDIQGHFIHSTRHSVLPYAELMESRTISQFIENLKGTPYFSILKTTADSDHANLDFQVEAKLQFLLYTTLFRKAQKLSDTDTAIAEALIGLKIDCLNVQWIFRAQKHYHFSPEQLLIHSLPGGYNMGLKRLKMLCYAESITETKRLTNRFFNSSIFEENDDMSLERNLHEYIYKNVTARRYRNSLGTAVSYIYLLEILMKEFIVATEAIRYKVPKASIGKYLIRPMGTEGVSE